MGNKLLGFAAEKWSTVQEKPIHTLLLVMGLAIVWFNVMGYRELFNEPPIFLGITPFGLLIGIAEFAVLMWTSKVIEDFPTASQTLKLAIIPVVLGFWFLCFTGINSYLKNSAYSEAQNYQTNQNIIKINKSMISNYEDEILGLSQELENLRLGNQNDTKSIEKLELTRQNNNKEKDLRRKGYKFCSQVTDCAEALKDYEDREKSYAFQVSKLQAAIDKREAQIEKLEAQRETIKNEKRNLTAQIAKEQKESSGDQAMISVKKQTYENIILSIHDFFGWEHPEDPFSIFIGFISFIIYPVYFLLNLFISLNSEANKLVRDRKQAVRVAKKERERLAKEQRHEIKLQLKAEAQAEKDAEKQEKRRIKAAIAKEKRVLAHRKAMDKLQFQTTNRGKLLKYFRAWAHRRTKTLKIQEVVEVEVEKIVNNEVEVIVEKEVFIEKEVQVEVDRIVQVEKEIPVYVDRVKIVPEPVFITEPEVVIHERIVPVPADISAKELEELLENLPPLNEASKSEDKVTVIS